MTATTRKPTADELRAAWLNRTTVTYRGHSWAVEKIITGEYELSRTIRYRINTRHMLGTNTRGVYVRMTGN